MYEVAGATPMCQPDVMFASIIEPRIGSSYSSGLRHRIENIPNLGGSSKAVYSLFDLNSPIAEGSGPLFGMRPDIISQLSLGSVPFRYNLAAAQPNTSFETPANVTFINTLDVVSIVVAPTGAIAFTDVMRDVLD